MRHGPSDTSHGFYLRDVLRGVTRVVTRRPRLTLAIVFILSCASVVYTVARIEFKTDRADLIDPQSDFHQRWLRYTENFGSTADMVVVVESQDRETILRVLDELGRRMEQHPELFQNVFYKVPVDVLARKGLQYRSPEELEAGLQRLAAFRPILQGEWDMLKLDAQFVQYNQFLSGAAALGFSTASDELLRNANHLANSLYRFLLDREDFVSPWKGLVPADEVDLAAAMQPRYLLNERGDMGFLNARPVQQPDELDGPTKAIDSLRAIIDDVQSGHASVRIGLTGIPVLENDEMRKSKSDMLLASLLSFFGVGALLFLGFRGLRHPVLALAMLAVGMAWAFGFTTGSVGHLNILSVSFAVVLIGLGIDFGIHYLARYLELRHAGRLLRPALLEASNTVGTGIVTAAVTTALAFFCTTLTNFLGVAELGIIAGGGILLCALATFLVLPAMVALADQHVEPRKLPTPFEGNWLRLITSRYPLTVTLLSFGVIGYFAYQAFPYQDGRFNRRITYDYNLLHLQADGLESVKTQKRIFQGSEHSLLYAISMADGVEDARELKRNFEALPSVQRVVTLADSLPVHPPRETQLLVQAYAAELARLPASPPELAIPQPQAVGQAMEKLLAQTRQLADPLAVRTTRIIDQFLDEFEKLAAADQVAFLRGYQERMIAALVRQLQMVASAADAEPVTLADFPPEYVSRYVSANGKWLLQVFPKYQVWDIEPLGRFVEDVRSVDPEATGTPLQNYEASQQITESYSKAALYAFVVICLVLMIDFLGHAHSLMATLLPFAVVACVAVVMRVRGQDVDLPLCAVAFVGMSVAIAAILDFRSVCYTALAMLPPLGGGLMMFGVLVLLGVSLNPANLIVLPLILGIGVDDGVHVIHDYRHQTGRYRMASSTINAIVLTSLTTMIGFGSLMVAAHYGLYSLGLVLVVGVGSCLFVSLVTLPAILALIDGGRPRRQSSDAPVPAAGAESYSPLTNSINVA